MLKNLFLFLFIPVLFIFTLQSTAVKAFSESSICESKQFLNAVFPLAKDKANKPTVKQVNKARQILIKVCNFFNYSKIVMPKKITVLFVKKAGNAYFNKHSNSIFFPIQFLSKKSTKHPVKSVPIAVHELGHAYFNTNIYAYKTSKTYTEIEEQWRGKSLAYIKTVKKTYTSLHPSATSNPFATPFNSLHELFADSFAALYFGKPNIISEALFFANSIGSKRGEFAKKRNFLNRNFSHLRGKSINSGPPHHQFDKARYHLWKYYLSNAKYQNKKKQLYVLLKIFEKFLHQAHSTNNFEQTPALVANDLLIDLIDKHFDTLY